MLGYSIRGLRMKSEQKYDIAEEYTATPIGRYKKDSRFSGEGFKEILADFIQKEQPVCLIMDNTSGYNPSFLEEAFGGLIRDGFSKASIEKYIRYETADPSLVAEILFYIDDAVNQLTK